MIDIKTSSLRSEFQEFMFSNSIIVSAAGWAVGVATKEFIQSFLEKSLIPLFLGIGNLFIIAGAKKWVQQNSVVLTYFWDIIWVFLLWMLTIIFTFIILEYIFNRHIVGMRSQIKDGDKAEFDKSIIIKEDFNNDTKINNNKIDTNTKKQSWRDF